jgi:hypothetical protein
MKAFRATAVIVIALFGLLAPAAAQASFGLLPGEEGFSVSFLRKSGAGEEAETLSGAHPFEVRADFRFKSQGGLSEGDMREMRVDLPPGLIANPLAIGSQCSERLLETPRSSPFGPSNSGESCPGITQVGIVTFLTDREEGRPQTFGVFNIQAPPGAAAELAAAPFGEPVRYTPFVREEGGTYGLTLAVRNFTQGFDLRGMSVELWGNPWSAAHDGERGNCLNEADPAHPHGKCSVDVDKPNHSPTPFVTLPTECNTPLRFKVRLRSWQGEAAEAEGASPPLEGCSVVQFEPKPVARLSTARTTSSTGFDFSLDGNAVGLINPDRRAGSQVRNATVTFADGISINPSLGAGLGYCTPSVFEAIRAVEGPECPNDSKIGAVEVESPLLENPMNGGVYLAQPDDPFTGEPGAENPFDTLIGLYLIAKSPVRGLLVKVPGELEANLANGNLIAHFTDVPMLPYSHFNVHFRDGQRSPLASPPACGIYSDQVDLAPWADPSHHELFSSRFELNTGIGGGPCPSGLQPFAPTAKGGTANRNAGSYTPFYLRLARSDAEQEITSYSATLPPGLLGRLVGIPYCPEAAIAHAARNSGFAELEHPSCPAASLIGHTTAGYGLGSALTYAPGNLYLAGPHGGQPFSIVAIDSAIVGPFDLGVVIVRSAIDIEPRTAQVSIDSAASDPIPHIIRGIPIHLRDVRVYIHRPGFTLNPTSCEPMTLDSSLTGAGANLGTKADDPRAGASVPFQVSNCSAMGFRPALTLRLRGHARRGDFPSLTATYRPRPGDANQREATVTLARTMFLAQSHIQTVCTRKQFAVQQCPKTSIYGRATAVTPLLGAPLKGPVYLRASENTLPDLVASISGGGVTTEVVGRISSYKGSLRAAFTKLPDAPVKRFTVNLFGGERGLIEAAADVCANPQPASARFIGQNNKGVTSHPAMVGECNGKKKRKHKHAKHGRGHR